jgi:Uncharacterized protein conserved in bacteria (DUF2252)
VNVHKATESFEKWKGERTPLIKQDLQYKHEQMTLDVFSFFRATFYRWVQLWDEVCPEESKAPQILAVGDLHVENFGTWRDIEGRLIWGVNDFDEVYPMPYTIDLVRLAVSAHIAAEEEHLTICADDVCDAILEGYRNGLNERGRPFVLAEQNKWLRLMALNRLRDPVRVWKRAEKLEDFRGNVPAEIEQKLEEDLPERGLPYVKKRRVAGLGSLGHLRVLALARWDGGWIAREAKALAPSAYIWAHGGKSEKILYSEMLARAIRTPDPFLHIYDRFLVRRIAPDCSRILLGSLPEDRDEARLLSAMGFETANIHLGSRSATPAILRDLKGRPRRWLHRHAKKMLKAIRRDWKKWRAG